MLLWTRLRIAIDEPARFTGPVEFADRHLSGHGCQLNRSMKRRLIH